MTSFNIENLHLPQDRQTINAWSRSFYALNPIVSTTIDFYSTYPLKFLNIDSSLLRTSVAQFFDEQIAALDLKSNLIGIMRDIWLFGESFVYMELSEADGKWSECKIYDPDYIVIKSNIDGGHQYYLRPDEKLRDAVLNKKEDLLKNINKSIIDYVSNGENIPLDNFYFSHFFRKTNSYETRGTGILTPIFALLQQNDNQNLSTIKEAIYYPYDLRKNMISESMKMKIVILLEMLKEWLIGKIFNPIAKINNFYEHKNGNNVLAIPTVTLNINDIFNDLPDVK